MHLISVWLIRSVGYSNVGYVGIYADRLEKAAENSGKSKTNIEIEREIGKQKREVAW